MAVPALRYEQLLAVSDDFRVAQEFFGELAVPLVSAGNAMPLLRELTVFGKARRVDNSVNGGFCVA